MAEILAEPLYAVALSGLIALVYAFARSQWISTQDAGTEKMQ